MSKEYWNPHSRIGRAFLEFGYDDNPFCNLLLKHFLAAAIQVKRTAVLFYFDFGRFVLGDLAWVCFA